LEELKKINPDVNKAIESLLHVDSREPGVKSEKEEVLRLWPFLKDRVQSVVDQAIVDAKRGY